MRQSLVTLHARESRACLPWKRAQPRERSAECTEGTAALLAAGIRGFSLPDAPPPPLRRHELDFGRPRPAARRCASGRTGRRARSRRSTSACSTTTASPRAGAATASASCGCCGSRRRRSGWSIAATTAARQGDALDPAGLCAQRRAQDADGRQALHRAAGRVRAARQHPLLPDGDGHRARGGRPDDAARLARPLPARSRRAARPAGLRPRRLGRAARQPARDDGRGDRRRPPCPAR